MTPEHLELLAHRAGCKLPRVMARKRRDDSVCHAVLFTSNMGRKDVEIELNDTDEAALQKLEAAKSG